METDKRTIMHVVDNNQCVACGLCKAVCPKNCIEMNKKSGMFLPCINNEKCIKCGICDRVCPGNQFDYNREYKESCEPENFWIGEYRKILSMRTENQEILKSATSGGVATQIIKTLLDKGEYDCAFLVDTHNYAQQVCTKKVEKTDDILKSAKSRYIPVAQNEAVAYALKNREKRIIFVGTSCFVHGIINVLWEFSLNRDNYFIVGLFCDRTMHYGIYDYFNQHPKCNGRLDQLLFRTKESGGWPGNMRLTFHDGGFVDVKASERMQVKDYFQLERCLYCLDKLNQFADISIGDDYAVSQNDKSGRSVVIVRTKKGEKIIESMVDCFDSFAVMEEALIQAQKLHLREKNLKFTVEKKLEVKVPQKVKEVLKKQDDNIAVEYQNRLAKLKIGEQCDYRQIISAIPTKKKIRYWVMDSMRFVSFFWGLKNFIQRIRKFQGKR